MNREELLNEVNEICREVFEDEDLNVADETQAKDVAGWDSLTHVELIAEVEDKFHFKFTMGEVQGFSNVGELLDTILKRIEK